MLNKHIAFARRVAARNQKDFLPDYCTITRDPQHTANDSINWTTGDLTASTPTMVYSRRCSVNEAREPTTSTEQGGMESYRQRYRVRLPAGLQAIRVGDIFTVTSSYGDPSLATTAWRVERVAQSSKRVLTRLRIERVVPGESR